MDKTIRKMLPEELKHIYKSIELDFAEGEYAPYDVLAKQIEKGVQQGYIFHNGEKDVAYSICADGCANRYILISLLAVYKEFRGNGLGSTYLLGSRHRLSHMGCSNASHGITIESINANA